MASAVRVAIANALKSAILYLLEWLTLILCSIDGNMVTLVVGEDKIEILVHENLLRKRSAFYEAALRKPWTEASTRRILLTEDNAATVKLYVRYVHSGKLPIKHDDAPDGSSATKEYQQLAKLYVHGEKMIDETLKRDVLDAIVLIGMTTFARRTWYPI